MTTQKLRDRIYELIIPFAKEHFAEAYMKVADHTGAGVDIGLLSAYSQVTDSFVCVASEIIDNPPAVHDLIAVAKPIAIYGFNAREHFMINWLFRVNRSEPRKIWHMPKNNNDFFRKVFIDIWHEALNNGIATPFLERMALYDPYKAMLARPSSSDSLPHRCR